MHNMYMIIKRAFQKCNKIQDILFKKVYVCFHTGKMGHTVQFKFRTLKLLFETWNYGTK